MGIPALSDVPAAAIAMCAYLHVRGQARVQLLRVANKSRQSLSAGMPTHTHARIHIGLKCMTSTHHRHQLYHHPPPLTLWVAYSATATAAAIIFLTPAPGMQ